MMDAFNSMINDLLVNTFRSILKLEEQMLKHLSDNSLSINELHMLEAIHRQPNQGRSITDIAQELDITLPSVTAAVKKLMQKGYVRKQKSGQDGRMVIVQLSEDGKRAEAAHRFFHRRMVQAISEDILPEEREVLLKGLQNLQLFFKKQEEQVREQGVAKRQKKSPQGVETF